MLPSNKNRSLLVHSLVKQLGLLTPDWSDEASAQLFAPIPAQRRDLTVYHDPDYVDFVLSSQNHSDLLEDPRRSEFGIEEVQIILISISAHVSHRTVQHLWGYPATCA